MWPTSTPPLKPEVILPVDEGLPGLSQLFDNTWVWRTFCSQYGEPNETPKRIRPQQLHYRPGVRALVTYAAEWQRNRWVVEDQFAVEMRAGKAERLFRYPDDPYLPGLRLAGSAADAQELVKQHVRIRPQRLRVEAVRYLPSTRAVLRHIASWRRARSGSVSLFARVMAPRKMERFLAAADLALHSGFNIPQQAGCWKEGGVVWMNTVPGDTVRTLIREGTPPDPDQFLEPLASLWSSSFDQDHVQPLNLLAGFHTTERLLSQLLRSEEARGLLQRVSEALGPFALNWQPSALAHNDFYDDQILITPEGHLALVDFEEIGPGDPLLDVGKLLAHLRRMAQSGNGAEACKLYRQRVRSSALARFGWESQDLDLREAFALFRLSTGPIRRLQRSWEGRVEAGLAMVAEALGDRT